MSTRKTFTCGWLIDNRCYAALMFELRDVWVGVFWDRDDVGWRFYVCLLPTLVIYIHWR